MARLLIKSGGTQSQVIELKLGVNRFGRSADNDFQIEHPTVSGFHCEVELGNGRVHVRDCGSTNGTFVAGQKIREADLLEGQLLCIGDVELLVESTELKVAIPKFEVPYEAPAPPVVLSDGSLLCPRHPQARVTHRCTHCQEVMCEACVHRLRRRGGKLLELCPRCSHPCEPIGEPKKKKKKKLLQFLTTTVRLPFLHTIRDDK